MRKYDTWPHQWVTHVTFQLAYNVYKNHKSRWHMACQTWVHVTLGDVSVPHHSRQISSRSLCPLLPMKSFGAPKSKLPPTTSQYPFHPTVEIGPCRSIDIRSLSLHDFDVWGFGCLVLFLLSEWSAQGLPRSRSNG